VIEIRPATEKDFPYLPDVENDAGALFADFGLSEISAFGSSPENFYRSLPKGSIVLVAMDAAWIVGFSVGLVVDGQAYLREVSVRRSHAKQGIGKRLVEGVIQWAVTQDFRAITLTTFLDLPFNAPFYRNLGFQEFRLHRRRIGIGQHQREGVVRARLHGGEDIGGGEAFIAKPWRALAALPPDMADAPLLADARLVLEEQADALAFMTCTDGSQQRRGSF